VSGNDHLSFKVRLRDIIDHPLFEDMIIDCQMELGSQVKNLNRIWTPGKTYLDEFSLIHEPDKLEFGPL